MYLSIFAVGEKKDTNYKAVAEIVCQIASTSNVFITFIWFIILFPVWNYGDETNWVNFDTAFRTSYGFWVHLFPLISTTINNVFLSDISSYMSDTIWIFLIVLLFVVISGLFTLVTSGRYIYPFLSFQDWMTPVFLLVIFITTSLFHCALSIIL